MAEKKISQLTEATNIDDSADYIPFVDQSVPETKRMTFGSMRLMRGGAFLHVQDQKANNTAGGTFTQDAWQTRTLNTEVTNTITGASLASNQITLPAGTYYIEASAPAYAIDSHKAKLRNITASEDTLIGTNEYTYQAAGPTGYVVTRSFIAGIFTIAAQKVFEIQHYCQTTKATNGLGQASNFSVIEVYTDVRIWKLS